MTKDIFKASLEATFGEFSTLVEAENGDWTVKGFIDLYKNIYTISMDTKVIELMLS